MMPKDLGDIRKRKGMSINQLASKSGIPISTLLQYERGEREILSRDLGRLAKALFIDEWDINVRSSQPKPPRPKRPPKPPRPKEEPPKEKKLPRKSLPARESQITHLIALAAHFEVDRTVLETEIGKPLDELTRKEARHWNDHFMRRVVEERPLKQPIDRKRAYLPEGVDGFELAYLQEQQEKNVLLGFTLFDGQTFEGTIAGFDAYHILVRESGGAEITLNKLAIAYYRKDGGVE
ncbi:MAG: helix-turn-helix transcriptional regulator [Chloroflexi bacterium]|nr:helix-turn-helix transcriptional regulator [Chloroflexota bacterium]